MFIKTTTLAASILGVTLLLSGCSQGSTNVENSKYNEGTTNTKTSEENMKENELDKEAIEFLNNSIKQAKSKGLTETVTQDETKKLIGYDPETKSSIVFFPDSNTSYYVKDSSLSILMTMEPLIIFFNGGDTKKETKNDTIIYSFVNGRNEGTIVVKDKLVTEYAFKGDALNAETTIEYNFNDTLKTALETAPEYPKQ